MKMNRNFVLIVAQTFSLPYRRISFCCASKIPATTELSDPLQIENLRYSRLKVCATWLGVWPLTLLLTLATLTAAVPPPLKVSENRRFLVTADNQPFFWLGDTAWELFHRSNREDAEQYLKKRAEQRFTVVQAVVLAEVNGLNDPNAYGDTPLHDNDPTRPNETYFQHVDWIV